MITKGLASGIPLLETPLPFPNFPLKTDITFLLILDSEQLKKNNRRDDDKSENITKLTEKGKFESTELAKRIGWEWN